MTPKEIKNQIAEENPDALFLDGMDGDEDVFNEALLGSVERCAFSPVALYDSEKIIDILIEKYEMDETEALEWYSYNIVGAYCGEGTPMFFRKNYD